MIKKGTIYLLVMAMLLLVLSACAGSQPQAAPESQATAQSAVPASEPTLADSQPQPTDETKKRVGISVMFAHPYFEEIGRAVGDVMGPEGYEIISQIGEYNVEKQIADVEDFIAMGVSAIFIEPFDYKGIRPALEAAQKANIPVICLDAPAYDVDLIVANVATDNYQAGVACAEAMIKDLGGKGNIVVIDAPGIKSCLDRTEGFVDTINAKAPDIVIVAQQNCDANQDMAMSAMENILQAQKDFQGVFVINENASLGVITAMEAVQRLEGVKIYSINGGSATEVALIRAGKLVASATQQPYEIGAYGAEAMLKYIAGEPVEKEISVPIIFLTKDNIDSYTPVFD